jgi:hypothetical protein
LRIDNPVTPRNARRFPIAKVVVDNRESITMTDRSVNNSVNKFSVGDLQTQMLRVKSELAAMERLYDEIKNVTQLRPRNGALLIRHTHFDEYAMGFLKENYPALSDLPWWLEVDIVGTLKNCETNHVDVDFAGVTYWLEV